MRKIRYLRKRRYRDRSQYLIVGLGLLIAFYFLILAGVQVNSFTNASFNDVEKVNGSLAVEGDWDKSSLTMGTIIDKTCGEISVTVSTNQNPILYSTWRYYVYKVSASKTPIGEPIDSGVIPPMQGNSSFTIVSTKVVENGTYQFKLRRPMGHPGNVEPDGYSYIWSDPITVTDCTQ